MADELLRCPATASPRVAFLVDPRSLHGVTPAQAGVQTGLADILQRPLDSRLRGNDGPISAR